ncbi:L-fucose:H+ symporter permease [Sphingomonas yantingensis]|uniref:FHS family L-fucose permease-like MFS transporter n=1 Tax=Sphingomonas yantingensis TaxID=1241761 RepID=A0A7W9AR71_9SPHN|nr:L-fucose:H+ symporter permease [Sphingomonas yantingensis]MBB5699108.1 FHS family L-fucose permease-like MFS transporter [Sphingomonas yantingensis]
MTERTPPAAALRPALILTVCLFFLWGMANNLNDILIAQFRKAFVLSDFETSFVQQVFYLGYFLFAVPAAMLTRARGYKPAIVAGLLLYAAGATLFYPAAQFGEYHYFLAALFVIACGLAFLETSANPLMTEIGDPAGAARRLNWAQAANPVGTLAGVAIGKYFILGKVAHDDAAIAAMPAAQQTAVYREAVLAVQGPYLVIGLVVLGFAIAALLIRFPQHSAREFEGSGGRFVDVLRRPRLLGAAAAQFFYVGAQVGLWSYTIRYVQAGTPGTTEASAADFLFASLLLFGVGRFAGSALMTRIAPARLLALFAAISFALTLVAWLAPGSAGLYALVAASFFMSIQFPTIFALGMEGLGPLARTGASLIIMAIIGGAVLTGLMGFMSDRFGIAAAMLVPAGCFMAVLLFALRARRPVGATA